MSTPHLQLSLRTTGCFTVLLIVVLLLNGCAPVPVAITPEQPSQTAMASPAATPAPRNSTEVKTAEEAASLVQSTPAPAAALPSPTPDESAIRETGVAILSAAGTSGRVVMQPVDDVLANWSNLDDWMSLDEISCLTRRPGYVELALTESKAGVREIIYAVPASTPIVTPTAWSELAPVSAELAGLLANGIVTASAWSDYTLVDDTITGNPGGVLLLDPVPVSSARPYTLSVTTRPTIYSSIVDLTDEQNGGVNENDISRLLLRIDTPDGAQRALVWLQPRNPESGQGCNWLPALCGSHSTWGSRAGACRLLRRSIARYCW